jgi:hypothetical protein
VTSTLRCAVEQRGSNSSGLLNANNGRGALISYTLRLIMGCPLVTAISGSCVPTLALTLRL